MNKQYLVVEVMFFGVSSQKWMSTREGPEEENDFLSFFKMSVRWQLLNNKCLDIIMKIVAVNKPRKWRFLSSFTESVVPEIRISCPLCCSVPAISILSSIRFLTIYVHNRSAYPFCLAYEWVNVRPRIRRKDTKSLFREKGKYSFMCIIAKHWTSVFAWWKLNENKI